MIEIRSDARGTSGDSDFLGSPVHRHPDPGTPLPDRLRWAVEALSGFDMRGVRVHFDSALPAQVGARAFAYGEHIYVAPGAEDALAHEAWHVVQQKRGRVAQTTRVNGIVVNDDPRFEVEADLMGEAVERLSRSLASGDWPRRILDSRPVMQPVVQREKYPLPTFIVVDDQPRQAKEVRNVLGMKFNMTNQTYPFLQEAVEDICATYKEHANWDSVRIEAKRRSFGYRHVDAMTALMQAQETPRRNFMSERNYSEKKLQYIIKYFQGATSNSIRNLGRKHGTPTFITWASATPPLKAQAAAFTRKNAFYKWYTNANNSSNPLRMNCWECVLYSGGWTNNGTRVPLYGRDYALWALLDSQLPTSGGLGGKGMVESPFFVYDIVNNAVYQSFYEKKKGQVNNTIEVPKKIPAGMIVAFNNVEHVALVTGRTRQNSEEKAIAYYGAQGHEVLELDGKTYWMKYGTIEDDVAVGYNNSLHFGWLPELTNPQQIRLETPKENTLLYQVTPTATNFYT